VFANFNYFENNEGNGGEQLDSRGAQSTAVQVRAMRCGWNERTVPDGSAMINDSGHGGLGPDGAKTTKRGNFPALGLATCAVAHRTCRGRQNVDFDSE
jgi:hypothetical protein